MRRIINREETIETSADSVVCYDVYTEYSVHDTPYLIGWTVYLEADKPHSGFVGTFKFVSDASCCDPRYDTNHPSIKLTWKLDAVDECPRIYSCTSRLSIKAINDEAPCSSEPLDVTEGVATTDAIKTATVTKMVDTNTIDSFILLEPEKFVNWNGCLTVPDYGGYSSSWIEALHLRRGIVVSAAQMYTDIEDGSENFPRKLQVAIGKEFEVTWKGGRLVDLFREYPEGEPYAGAIGGELVAAFRRIGWNH